MNKICTQINLIKYTIGEGCGGIINSTRIQNKEWVKYRMCGYDNDDLNIQGSSSYTTITTSDSYISEEY